MNFLKLYANKKICLICYNTFYNYFNFEFLNIKFEFLNSIILF